MKTVYQQLLVLLVVLGASPLASAEPPYPDPERYRETIEAFLLDETLNPPPVNAIVTTGSSSMRGWHSRIAQDLHPLSIIPRGFGGSNMYDLHYFLEDLVLRHEPRAVMLYEGDNDAALGASTEQVMRYFSAIVTKIHNELPSTRIYILAVKPSVARWEIWPAMTEINRQLRLRASSDVLVTYIDIATPMLSAGGKPLQSIFLDDMLHMNDAGYDLWRDAVRPAVIPTERGFEHTVSRAGPDE